MFNGKMKTQFNVNVMFFFKQLLNIKFIVRYFNLKKKWNIRNGASFKFYADFFFVRNKLS